MVHSNCYTIAPQYQGSLGMAVAQNRPKLPEDSVPVRPLGDPHRSERRERRSPLCVMLHVCGFSASGRIFSELTSTLNISSIGCCIRLKMRPQEGAPLALQVMPREGFPSAPGRPLLYQLAWLQQREQEWHVGLLALGPSDLLQVAFAPHTP